VELVTREEMVRSAVLNVLCDAGVELAAKEEAMGSVQAELIASHTEAANAAAVAQSRIDGLNREITELRAKETDTMVFKAALERVSGKVMWLVTRCYHHHHHCCQGSRGVTQC
jgi:hypothetical protein